MMMLLLVARFRDTKKANRLKAEQAKEYLEAKEQLEKAVAMSNVMVEQNRIINSKFEDNVDMLKEQFEKALARYTDTILANLSTILHVKAQVEQKEPESLSSKVMSAVKENIPKSKDKSIDEMIKDKVGIKTGKRMGHISMSGAEGSLESFKDIEIQRKIFIHINTTNPALLENSKERKIANDLGWEIAYDSMEIKT